MILKSNFGLYFGTLVAIAGGFVGGVVLAGSDEDGPAEKEVYEITLQLVEGVSCATDAESLVSCQSELDLYRKGVHNSLKQALEASSVEGETYAVSSQRVSNGGFGLTIPLSDSGLNHETVSNRLHQILQNPEFVLVETSSLELVSIPANEASIVWWQAGLTVGAVAGFLYALGFAAVLGILSVSRRRGEKSESFSWSSRSRS